MGATTTVVKRRERVTQIFLAVPEATSGGSPHIAYRVRGKTFVYYLDDHHGDGRSPSTARVARASRTC